VGVALLDSSAVVAFLDASDALHDAADRAVRAAARAHGLAVSTVTIAELLTGAKLGHHDEAVVQQFFSRVIGSRFPVDEQVAVRAADLRATTRALRMPDALILATGDLRADLVVTGDARWSRMRGVASEIVTLS
jgi:predicted nucleic acid-binding protein